MTRRSAALFGAWLSLLILGADGCRTTTICTLDECRVTAPAGGSQSGEGGESFQTPAPVGGNGARPPLGGAGLSGEGSAGGADGAGGAPEPSLSCGVNLADCDGSRLTPCETNVTWTWRHCGGCGKVCDGLCLGGSCNAGVNLLKGWATSMVASSTTGFAVVDEPLERSLLQIDVASAEAHVIRAEIPDSLELSISSDRVYFFDSRAVNPLTSVDLDGSALKTEEVDSPIDFGATAQGAYYVSEIRDENGARKSTTLFFRASAGTSWKALYVGPSCRILRSSANGLVVARYEQGDEYEEKPPLLDLYVGEDTTALGLAPANLEEVAVTRNAVVVLSYDEVSYRLWWSDLQGSPLTSYEIAAPGNSGRELIVDEDQVVMFFVQDGKGFIQAFTSNGALLGRAGLDGYASVVHEDRNYLWYSLWDDGISPRFLRSKRSDFDL